MATFTPVLITEFCQPDETMPFGKEIVKIVRDIRIALPSITGTPMMSYPQDGRYKIEVHIPGKTFGSRKEPLDFKFVAPSWILGRDMAIHRALGRIQEEYRGGTISPSLGMICRRDTSGNIITTPTDDPTISYIQTLETHIRALEVRVRSDTKTIKRLMNREIDLEADVREAQYEHELEAKDFLERIEKLKTRISELEEQMDMGENLHPEGDMAPFISDDDDYEESTTGGLTTMQF